MHCRTLGTLARHAKTLYVITCLALGSAGLVNVSCGLQHRTIWGRGGLRTYGKTDRVDRICYALDLIVFSAGGTWMLVLAGKFWFVTP
jgi:hypothetical protein